MCSSNVESSGFANRLFILVFVFSLKVRNSRHFCAGLFDTQTTTNSTQNDAERTVTKAKQRAARLLQQQQHAYEQNVFNSYRRNGVAVSSSLGRRKRDDERWFRKPIRRRESTQTRTSHQPFENPPSRMYRWISNGTWSACSRGNARR